MKKKLIILTLSLLSIFPVSCTTQQQKKQVRQPAPGVISSYAKVGDINKVKITSDSANITTGCSPNAPVIQSASKNNTFDVVSQVQDWFAVKLPNNTIGFVPQGQCTPIVSDNKTTPTLPSGSTGASIQPGTSTQPSTVPKTPAAQTNSGTLSNSEQKMLNLVNSVRAQNNLPALKVDTQLCNVARVKSQDMIDNNYFSHYSPKYGSPSDMIKSFGVNYVTVGENIAGNQNVQSAQNALMNSPEHRKNILSSEFTHIGIGIKQGGPYGTMFTQQFISRPE
ncbi:CAP domain-containing protein [Clostridium sp. DJ247]|uniref:CAP domain-containing protein n=1 Tax=Clostridium sp. DJ247 TaxID=2726188 RepID=UPI0016285DDF|nr:CAP domain-containing protein [Clostridium sp. DJ247]MBC2581324.1 serine protease [Clostridium sp. DJ247]